VNIIRDCAIGKNTNIREPVNFYKCSIGENCRIGGFVYIEEGVVIGDNCKIRPMTFIPTGVTIEDGVFIGPGVTFTNDRYPRAVNRDGTLKDDADWTLEKTVIKTGASIGAGATLMCGITVHEYAVVGAGAAVTKDVPARAVVAGNPAHVLQEEITW
jgi:acetyltransferase-like isoleucine patch superfamily enzyme